MILKIIMKKAKEYLDELCPLFVNSSDLESLYADSDVLSLIKQVQIDVIDETVKKCANLSGLTYVEYEWEIPEGASSTGDSQYGYSYVDINKILQVAEELISKL